MDQSKLLPEIKARRSIRKYTSQAVEQEKIDLLLEAARLAPSVCNLQPLKILVVNKPVDLAFVSRASYSLGAVATAPLIFVALVQKNITDCLSVRVGELLENGAIPQINLDNLVSAEGKPFKLKLGNKYTYMSAAAALEHIVLQALHLNLGSCWVNHFDEAEVRAYFSIPPDFEIISLLTLGYAEENPKPRPRLASLLYSPPVIQENSV